MARLNSVRLGAAALALLTLGMPEVAEAQRSLGTLTVEMHYDTPATVVLPIVNGCATAERVEIFLFGLDFITKVPPFEIVGGHSTRNVLASAHPPPLPPVLLGPGQTARSIDMTRLEKGFLAYAYGGRVEPPCAPTYEGWDVVVKLTPRPAGPSPTVPPPPPPTDPVALFTTNPCTMWWLTGSPPNVAGGRDLSAECLGPMRRLALDYRERVLGPFAAADPASWTWLPDAAAIGRMTIPDTLALKTRAAEIVQDAARRSQP